MTICVNRCLLGKTSSCRKQALVQSKQTHFDKDCSASIAYLQHGRLSYSSIDSRGTSENVELVLVGLST